MCEDLDDALVFVALLVHPDAEAAHDVRALVEDLALLKGRQSLELMDDAIADGLLPVANELEECSFVAVPVLKFLELEEPFAPAEKV